MDFDPENPKPFARPAYLRARVLIPLLALYLATYLRPIVPAHASANTDHSSDLVQLFMKPIYSATNKFLLLGISEGRNKVLAYYSIKDGLIKKLEWSSTLASDIEQVFMSQSGSYIGIEYSRSFQIREILTGKVIFEVQDEAFLDGSFYFDRSKQTEGFIMSTEPSAMQTLFSRIIIPTGKREILYQTKFLLSKPYLLIRDGQEIIGGEFMGPSIGVFFLEPKMDIKILFVSSSEVSFVVGGKSARRRYNFEENLLAVDNGFLKVDVFDLIKHKKNFMVHLEPDLLAMAIKGPTNTKYFGAWSPSGIHVLYYSTRTFYYKQGVAFKYPSYSIQHGEFNESLPYEIKPLNTFEVYNVSGRRVFSYEERRGDGISKMSFIGWINDDTFLFYHLEKQLIFKVDILKNEETSVSDQRFSIENK